MSTVSINDQSQVRSMTPLQVEILLHYWYCPDDFKLHSEGNAGKKKFCEELVRLGILSKASKGTNFYEANMEALRPYVEAVLAVPLPVQVWVVPEKP